MNEFDIPLPLAQEFPLVIRTGAIMWARPVLVVWSAAFLFTVVLGVIGVSRGFGLRARRRGIKI
jgi:hypothetical protein